MPLLSLPLELVFLIAKNLGPKHLSHLIQCNRPLAINLTHVLHDLALQDIKSENGKLLTALQWAVSRGHEQLVRLLLHRGVQVDGVPEDQVQDRFVANPLHIAVGAGRLSIARCLLEHGADINYKYRGFPGSVTVIQTVMIDGRDQPGTEDMIKHLLERKADINDKSLFSGMTLLLAAATYENKTAIRTLLKNGAEISAQNNQGQSALHLAIRSEAYWLPLSQLLVGNGIDVNIRGVGGRTALHDVCGFGGMCGTEIISLLLNNGADINARGMYGNSALHSIISRSNCISNALLLVNQGADFNSENSAGHTALDLAYRAYDHELEDRGDLSALIERMLVLRGALAS